ncbi:MAG: phage terminase small subunit P27 family [Schwartzia sp.]|nr:phage terminase small subunit P27 family [Schwartzia sp. (in: firmicutes)]
MRVSRDEIENDVPAWLDDVAREEFQRVVMEAAAIPLFDNLDRSILAIYAANYSRYVTAESELKRMGLLVKVNNMPIPSPYVNIADKAANQIMRCSSKLGLAVTDRLRLIVPTKADVKESPVEKWLQFLPARGGARRKAAAE